MRKDAEGKSVKPIKKWLEPDNLMLIECWTRDGYTKEDIANRIGVSKITFNDWMRKEPAIKEAVEKGREIIDYKVENALLKAALGYRTKEVQVRVLMRRGEVVEKEKITIDKEQAPNISAAQCWLYNRKPDKWRNMNSRSNIIDNIDEDTSIQITVTRANDKSKESDEEWQDEVNKSIEIKKPTQEELRKQQREKRLQRREKRKAELSDVSYEE